MKSRYKILDLAVTLDGFIEGPNGEIDWCIMDDDVDFDGFLSSIDTIFYGRKDEYIQIGCRTAYLNR